MFTLLDAVRHAGASPPPGLLLASRLSALGEIPRARPHGQASAFDANVEPMPPGARHAVRRVADQITLPELLEDAAERRIQIPGRLDFDRSAAGCSAQVLQVTQSPPADFDAVDDHVAAPR